MRYWRVRFATLPQVVGYWRVRFATLPGLFIYPGGCIYLSYPWHGIEYWWSRFAPLLIAAFLIYHIPHR